MLRLMESFLGQGPAGRADGGEGEGEQAYLEDLLLASAMST